MGIIAFFSHIIGRLRWQDILDLAAVYFITYRLLVLIRGTRAVQILTGLGITAVLYIASDRAGLFALNYVLRLFFEYLFLIMIILFQDDIRRALANVGRNPFLVGNSSKSKAATVLDEIVKATMLLAAKRTGALIVLERQHGLKNYMEGATNLNADVTAELLISIFHSESPIHDGAVVVQGTKILAAGVFFPVDMNLDAELDRNLGTRHRTAVHLTLETDALVIVLSEERGEVSIVEWGEIERGLNMADLKNHLYESFDLHAELTAEKKNPATVKS